MKILNCIRGSTLAGKIAGALIFCLAVCRFAQEASAQEASGELLEPRVESVPIEIVNLAPEERGYHASYVATCGGITTLISQILYAHSSIGYWDSIDASNVSKDWSDQEAAEITELKKKFEQLDPWLKETIPPNSFIKLHQSMMELSTALNVPTEHARLGRSLRATYSAWKHLSWDVQARPPQPIEYEAAQSDPTIIVRPLFLPVIYNVTTGQWSLSLSISTPLGSVTISPPAAAKPLSQAKGLLLVKIRVGEHARYVLMPPGTSITFKKDELTADGFDWNGEVETIQFQPVRSQGRDPEIQIDERHPIRKALPVEQVTPTPRL